MKIPRLLDTTPDAAVVEVDKRGVDMKCLRRGGDGERGEEKSGKGEVRGGRRKSRRKSERRKTQILRRGEEKDDYYWDVSRAQQKRE